MGEARPRREDLADVSVTEPARPYICIDSGKEDSLLVQLDVSQLVDPGMQPLDEPELLEVVRVVLNVELPYELVDREG